MNKEKYHVLEVIRLWILIRIFEEFFNTAIL